MPICFVYGCPHRGEDSCKLLRFPKRHVRHWAILCRRKDRQVTADDRICSCHFKDGIKENGPSIFPWNSSTIEVEEIPRKQRKLINTTPAATSDGAHDSEAQGFARHHDHTYRMSYDALAESYMKLEEKTRSLEIQFEAIKLQRRPMTVADIINDDSKMLMYTSLKPDVFNLLDGYVQRFDVTYVDGWAPSCFSRTDQLLLTLMKLKMDLPLLDLAERFCTSATTINNIFATHVYLLHEVLYEQLIDGDLPSLIKCKASMPSSFADFSSCRLILDATEIRQDVPGNDLNLQAQTYSSYKTSHTVKSVTGVAPNGAIVYASPLYPGSVSDVAIVAHTGLLQKMEAGDLILADKGFTIHRLLPQGVHLNIPPFLKDKGQYTESEVKLCRQIARSRIHVERANERIKNYNILRHIPHQYRYISTKLFQVCCALVNFQEPLIREVAMQHETATTVK